MRWERIWIFWINVQHRKGHDRDITQYWFEFWGNIMWNSNYGKVGKAGMCTVDMKWKWWLNEYCKTHFIGRIRMREPARNWAMKRQHDTEFQRGRTIYVAQFHEGTSGRAPSHGADDWWRYRRSLVPCQVLLPGRIRFRSWPKRRYYSSTTSSAHNFSWRVCSLLDCLVPIWGIRNLIYQG